VTGDQAKGAEPELAGEEKEEAITDNLSKEKRRTPTQGGSQHDHHEDGPEGEAGPPTKRTQAKRDPQTQQHRGKAGGHPAEKEGGTEKKQKTDRQTSLTQV
jgi:hypothetical protein